MIWTVVHRDTDGSPVEMAIEADSREAVFAELKKRGIAAISVTQGSPSKRARSKSAKQKPMVWIILAVVGFVIAATAWIFLKKDSGLQPTDKLEGSQKMEAAPRLITKTAPKESATNNSKATTKTKTELYNGVQVVSRQATTNANGTIIERIRTADGKSHRVTKPPRPIFDNPSDQLIAMAISGANSGIEMPPLPMSDSVENDFKKSLESPIKINDDDSDEVKLMKMDVMAVRETLKDLVSQGMTVRDALAAHQEDVNKAAAYRKEALAILAEIRQTDGEDAAREFLEKVNKNLTEAGENPIATYKKLKSAQKEEQVEE